MMQKWTTRPDYPLNLLVYINFVIQSSDDSSRMTDALPILVVESPDTGTDIGE